MTTPTPHDPEMERAIKRALDLRITLTEISEYTGVLRATLYRWRYEVHPRHTDRTAFLEALDRLCSERLNEYMGVE